MSKRPLMIGRDYVGVRRHINPELIWRPHSAGSVPARWNHRQIRIDIVSIFLQGRALQAADVRLALLAFKTGDQAYDKTHS